MLWIFIVAAILFRLATLAISVRNERRLKAEGATEFGHTNSVVLALAHTAFYLAAAAEAAFRGMPPFDAVTWIGLVLYFFGAAMLVAVIRILGRLWTVKLLIASNHVLVEHPLFRRFRHPNYFLNILPELIGFGLALHSWYTLAIGLPLYVIPLAIRIRQEEKVMRSRFKGY
ncbi:isoprenylcysteine carboxylmethyltransferase family protein [Brucella sp. IR073]|uniref:isoprenylcysteine carboxylmethyltransferase family protein n=1 Tax=unclassified Brucella TaxID=2632610 RepID=UPI003B980074